MLKTKLSVAVGVSVVALALVVGGAVGIHSANADTVFTRNLTVGSSGADVMALQAYLNASGYTVASTGAGSPGNESTHFGPLTKAALARFQAANGISPAAGYFGPITRAWVNAHPVGMSTTGTLPPGCTSTSGFSPVNGQPCNSGGTSTVPGCLPGYLFSPTTGQSCSGSGGTTQPPGTGNGYLADLAGDSSNRVSTVYESESDKVVAGFRATARLSSQQVNRVRVTFQNTDTTASANLSKYITSASLWFGSTKIATMDVGTADRSTSNDVYTFNFAGLTNANIAKDQIGRFYVSVNAVNSLDSNDAANAEWAVSFPDGGIMATSPDGTTDTYNVASPVTCTDDITDATTGYGVCQLTFGKFASGGVKATVALSPNNPSATTISVSNTAPTNNVELLRFTIKSTNSDLTLRKVPIQIVSATASASSIINTIKLMRDGVLVDSVDGSNAFTVSGGAITSTASTSCGTCGYIFSNLSSPGNTISSGQTAEYSVVVDFKQVNGNYTEGNTVQTSFTNADAQSTSNFSVLDMNGDQLPSGSTYRVGSAVGDTFTLRVNGLLVTQGAATISTVTDQNGNITTVTYNIPLTVTAFGNTLYTSQTAQLATTTSSTNAFAFSLQSSTAPTVDIVSAPASTTVSSTLSSDASIENNAYRLDSGAAKHYTLQVIVTCSNAACSGVTTTSYRVRVAQAQAFGDNGLSTTDTIQNLVPIQNYQTQYQRIH